MLIDKKKIIGWTILLAGIAICCGVVVSIFGWYDSAIIILICILVGVLVGVLVTLYMRRHT